MVKTLNFSSEKLLSVDYIWTVLYGSVRQGPAVQQVIPSDYPLSVLLPEEVPRRLAAQSMCEMLRTGRIHFLMVRQIKSLKQLFELLSFDDV